MREKSPRHPAAAREARPVFTRIHRIHRLVAAGACPSVASLATDLEVSERTIQRDIEQLRNLYAPLVYDRTRNGYRYEGEYSLPRLQLTAGELAVLLIGQRLLADLAGTPFAQAARQVVDKLPLLLDEEVSVDLSPFAEEISFGVPKVRGDAQRLARHFDLLAAAAAQRRTVDMRYYTATRDAVTDRKFDPYHLRNEAGAWYAIGYCHLRDAILIFAVDRIERLALTDARFEKPADFDIKDYLGHSWGLERGREYLVRVAFDAEQARWIRERTWQEGQTLTETPDGGVILAVRVSGLEMIKRWILGFGRHAKVLEPAELAGMVRDEARGILGQG